jgi:tetratricopeptide (TPR) repeat protein
MTSFSYIADIPETAKLKAECRAIAGLDEVIRLALEEAGACAARGMTYYIKGDHDRAIADFGEAIRLARKRPVRRRRARAHKDRPSANDVMAYRHPDADTCTENPRVQRARA